MVRVKPDPHPVFGDEVADGFEFFSQFRPVIPPQEPGMGTQGNQAGGEAVEHNPVIVVGS